MRKPAVDFHGALSPLQEACRAAGILYTDDLMQASRSSGGLLSVLLRKADVAYRHARFALRVLRPGKDRSMLIREFSTVPLAVIFPLLRPSRNRLFFVVNHNLQWALQRPLERAAFRLLGRLGCRFVFFEIMPGEGLRRIGVKAENSLVIPHPVAEGSCLRTRPGGIVTVGVIGEYRREKGMDDLLGTLVLLPWRILLGVPNGEEFRKHSPFGRHPRLEIIDTAQQDAYRRAIAGCDVMILNHPASGYQFRASGLVADAAAAHVPAVVRRLPVLDAQISRPVRIGESFDGPEGLAVALKKTDENLCAGQYDFHAYCAARSAQALAGLLEEFSRRTDG